MNLVAVDVPDASGQLKTFQLEPRHLGCYIACWFCALLFFAGLHRAAAVLPPDEPPLPNYDRRLGTASAAAPGSTLERTASVTQLRRSVPGAKVDFDEVTGSPRWIRSAAGLLSGPAAAASLNAAPGALPANEPHRATRTFLNAHAQLFGHGAEVLAGARIKRDFVTARNGVRTVVWGQELDGIPVFEGLLVSHTTERGELVSLSSGFVASPAQAADRGVRNRLAQQARPTVSAIGALVIAMQDVGEELKPGEVRSAGQRRESGDEYERLQAPILNGDAFARLVWLPMDAASMRLCWEVLFTSRARGEMYRTLVDTQTGEVEVRHCLTTHVSPATYRVFTSDSPSPFSPGHSTPLTNQPPLVSRSLLTMSALSVTASPNGWIDDGMNETRGNNVDAHTDRDNNDAPDTPRPQGSPFRVFDFPLDLDQNPSTYTNASVVQLFYWNNFMHDKLYELGFNEAAGNFQNNNFGRGGLGNDAVQADAQDGGGFNNADFSTPPDGFPGRMQMYVFTFPTPQRDGDLDAEVILHEYAHGLSNRRVGAGVGISTLQGLGMGEGWSDFYAMALLSEAGDDVNAAYAYGGYVTYQLIGMLENYYFGIRRYPYCTDTNKNPLTFKDIDPTQANQHTNVPRSGIVSTSASEVHNMGEVWCVTLWEARARLIEKHGFATGNQLILQLVTDGMNLSPANPNFLESRDAILLADQIDNGGANLNELWAAFAKRGMGFSATSPPSFNNFGVQEAFDLPFAPLFVTVPDGATEGAGVLAGQGFVSIATPVGGDLIVNLSSSDTSEATVPANVTILAGQTNASFDITIVDDGILDGSQPVTVTASAPGYSVAGAMLRVDDNETATLTLIAPASVTEGDGVVTATVNVSAAPASDVEVSLISSDTTEIEVPSAVTIPAGQTAATFDLTVVDDVIIDGDQMVNLTAHVVNWTDGAAPVTVHDNETADLSVTLPLNASETEGLRPNAGAIVIPGMLPTNLVVALQSDDTTELMVPPDVTIVAGSTFALFDLTFVDDALVDGAQAVHVTASAPGFNNGVGSIEVLDDESPPLPINPRPPDLAVNVAAITNLMWENGPEVELIANGDFENGSLAGWTQVPSASGQFVINDGSFDPPGPGGPLPPFDGDFSALGQQSEAGPLWIYQQLKVPAAATTATLRWADRVRNHFTEFNTNQEYRVELRDTNDAILAVPFTTSPGDPLLDDWTQRSFDMTSFAGQTLRVAFWINPGLSNLEAHLDDVSLRVVSGGGVTDDVYFGTNPDPGVAEFQGSTTNHSWTLPLLAPLTTYYWRIVSHRVGTTVGPVWQFTTRGVDHFAWSSIASPQYVNQPFNGTVVARDYLGRTVSNYTGAVSLRAFRNTGGPAGIIEDFESGVWPHPPWQPLSTLGSISPTNAHDGNFGLKDPEWMIRTDVQLGVPGDRLSWWIRPSRNNCRAYLGFAASIDGCFSVVASVNTGQLILQENPFFLFGNLFVVPQTWQIGKWYKVEIQFASASAILCNLYDSDGLTLLNTFTYDTQSDLRGGIAMRSFGSFSLDTLMTGIPGDRIAMSPTNSGNFTNGAWTGAINIQQSGEDVTLLADDGANHLGLSNPFEVIYTNTAPIVFAQPTNQALYVGDTAKFTVVAEGSAPMQFQWYFNGLKIVGATSNSLTLANVQGSQVGSYSVRISNAQGVTVSSNALLTVLATPPCVPVPSGAVGWWQASGNFLDSIGGDHGTPAAGVSFGNGRVGQGLVFNSNGDGVQLGFATNLQLQIFSIETWIKRSSPSRVSLAPGSSTTIFLGYGQNGYGFGMNDSGGLFLTKIGVDNVTFGSTITDLDWHHVAMTKDGTNVVFYVDGVAHSVAPYLSTFDFTTTAAIGARGDNLANSFFGSMDEITIYNRGLSAGEIQSIYNARHTGKCPVPPVILAQPQSQTTEVALPVGFSALVSGSSPLAYQWRFNGNNLAGKTNLTLTFSSAQLTNDGLYSLVVSNQVGWMLSSNATLTVLTPPPCASTPSNALSWWRAEGNTLDQIGPNNGVPLGNTSYGAGRVGGTFQFDGNGDGVNLGNPLNLQLQSFTIEAWIKRGSTSISSISGDAQLFCYGQNGYGFGMFNDGRLLLTKVGVDATVTTVGVTDTNWHHVAVTKQDTNVVFYIDGTAHPVPAYNSVFSFSSSAGIGFRSDTQGNSFLGAIDELTIYGRGLTAQEIQSIRDAGVSGKCISNLGGFVTLPPQLKVRQTGGVIVVSWPAAPSGFILETSASLSPAEWVPIETPAQFTNGLNVIEIPMQLSETNRFYRLRHVGP